MTALPDDLLANVFGRLPARSLAASRYVCKAWRDVVDERRLLLRLRHLLPHSLRGLFINYQDYHKPHFFSRPALAAAGPRIKGKVDFIVRKGPRGFTWTGWHEVADHCNGLLLYRDTDVNVLYMRNPATQWWARLPPCPGKSGGRRAFLVFDPAVSPHYKVLLAPHEPNEQEAEDKDAFRLMEWPPLAWTWHEFSSRTGSWEEKVFVREGKAAGTVGDFLLKELRLSVVPRWRYGAYWQGELYIHCRGEYVSRLSLLDGTYQVIKSPIDLAECKNNVRTFLGRSEKGVYFAAIDARLRVWKFTESGDQTGWVSKHHSNLKTYSWWLHEQKYDGPWTLDINSSKKRNQQVSLKQDVCWNSDDDDIIDVSDDEDDSCDTYAYVTFLGFHPYKEVIFLCREGTAVAWILEQLKGSIFGSGIPSRYLQSW
ncbi:unnamed protein product [Urochloa decumbens]|uniref:F-box domain-containing protein n=1 Tax=Urochloa decumbens TaxID=240449 RepID=A0ABC9HAL7_9POAL